MVKVITVALFIGALSLGVVYAVFHGYFDRGNFQVERTEWSSSNQLVIVAKRSDHEALSGDQYFVLIGDHAPSATDLRRAYYNNGVIFRASSQCLTARWADLHHLVIACDDGSIQPSQIAVQQDQIGDVKVRYESIPHASKQR